MHEDEIRCPHCNNRKFASHPEHNYHKFDCPEQSKEQLIESIRKQNAVGHRYVERIRNLHTHITQWQGKFHTLRLENNALRKQVAKQKMKAEPQWHNPDDVTLSEQEKKAGWRFLTVGEKIVPQGCKVWVSGRWMETMLSGSDRPRNGTYVTTEPLPTK